VADVKPFRGFRYALEKPDDLQRVIAPPYDMIDERMRTALYEADAYNCVRLIQNAPQPGDEENRTRHMRASRLFSEWLEQGVLHRDPRPGIYPYRQEFSVGTGAHSRTYVRTGVIMRLRLVDFSEKIVIPHEHTLPGPKYDRYELLQEMHCNSGLIFGLVPDQGEIYEAMCRAADTQPVGVARDDTGVRHELFHCTDDAVIRALQQHIADRTVLIADGHHRYETSLKYARENPDQPAAQYVMTQLVSMADTGLVIRPFHRMVTRRDGIAPQRFLELLRQYFDMQDMGQADEQTVKAFCEGEPTRDLLYLHAQNDRLYRLTLNAAGNEAVHAEDNGMSLQWNALDVSVINTVVVERMLGMSSDGETLHDLMEYVKDFHAALTGVHEDPAAYYGCFFVTPMCMDDVRTIVEGGERMPQKSTNFHPKCYSGFVFNSLESE
jgi:uncharacterized protein (DUF1015 family)